jgi:hypothetical protein
LGSKKQSQTKPIFLFRVQRQDKESCLKKQSQFVSAQICAKSFIKGAYGNTLAFGSKKQTQFG